MITQSDSGGKDARVFCIAYIHDSTGYSHAQRMGLANSVRRKRIMRTMLACTMSVRTDAERQSAVLSSLCSAPITHDKVESWCPVGDGDRHGAAVDVRVYRPPVAPSSPTLLCQYYLSHFRRELLSIVGPMQYWMLIG